MSTVPAEVGSPTEIYNEGDEEDQEAASRVPKLREELAETRRELQDVRATVEGACADRAAATPLATPARTLQFTAAAA